MRRILAITTTIGCKIRCTYCPQEKFIKASSQNGSAERMSFETFKTCIDKTPQDVTINFKGFSEPWLNPDCLKMIMYANLRRRALELSTTLTAMKLSDIKAIQNIPFHRFAVHLPDKNGEMQVAVDQTYLDTLRLLLQSNISNVNFHCHQEKQGIETIHPEVKKVLKTNNTPFDKRWINSRAGNVPEKELSYPKRVSGELSKCHRFHQNILLPNGDVTLCCMDWELKHILGNLLTSDYESLFTRSQFKKVLDGTLDESIETLCRHCELAQKR